MMEFTFLMPCLNESETLEFATEMIARFAQSGEKIVQVPTPLRCDRRSGKPHLRTVRDGFRHLKFILSNKSNFKNWRYDK